MIRNLLFDLGGVIMDIEKSRCVEAFTQLGLKDAGSYFGDFSQQGPFMEIEAGSIDASGFHTIMHRVLPQGVTDAQIDHAFCQFLIGIPVRRLEALRQLRRRFKIYLLSNTNPIMWDSKIKEEFTGEGFTREDYFDGIVTSFEARALKPDRKIFDYACDFLGIKPEETLFIDDSSANLTAAGRLGFNTALAMPGVEFTELVEKALSRQ